MSSVIDSIDFQEEAIQAKSGEAYEKTFAV
jgi:hypothetical protein